MKKFVPDLLRSLDNTALYYFVLPILLSLGINGIYLSVMFYDFVFRN